MRIRSFLAFVISLCITFAFVPVKTFAFSAKDLTADLPSSIEPGTEVSGSTFTPNYRTCLLYTSDAADDMQCVDLGGRRIIKNNVIAYNNPSF